MTWKEFSDLSKSVFVQAASEEFGIKGRPTNISRVSILTGISRKEVKRQRDLLAVEVPQSKGKTTDATRVLSAWYQDSAYVDAESMPMLLNEHGPAPSFEALCAKYGGDIAATTMLKELLNTQNVERTGENLLRAIQRYYQPVARDDENLHFAVSLLRDLTETANNDVFLDDQSAPRFCRRADNEGIPAHVLPQFKEFVDQRGQHFLEEIDDWLTRQAVKVEGQTSEYVRVGVGLFAIEDTSNHERES